METDVLENEKFEDDWNEEDEQEWIENTQLIRGKWLMDDAETLTEAAKMLREYANELLELEKEDWQFLDPVHDDYGYIAKAEYRLKISKPD